MPIVARGRGRVKRPPFGRSLTAPGGSRTVPDGRDPFIEAVEAVADFRPDVLISDIGMPGEDGYTLIKRIRGMTPPEIAFVPAIALTAYARQEDRERALESGFQMHISKPVGYTELIEAVRKVAGSAIQTEF